MKSQLVIFVLVGLVAFAHCLPPAAREREELDETDDDQPIMHRVLVIPDFDTAFRSPLSLGDDDDDDQGPFNLFRLNFPEFKNPFPGLLDSLQNSMKRLREQMSRIPQPGLSYPFSTIPQGANKTSTTRVIGGHIVTINETTYRNDDPNSTFVFKVRTVDVEPQNTTDILTQDNTGDDADSDGGEQTEKTTLSSNKSSDTTTGRSVETVEDPGNNEIPDNQVETLQA